MPTATKAASRLSSPESEDTARADTPPVHATGGFKKRPAAEAGEAKPAKRSAVAAPQAGASVARLQAAWRGFRVRGEGVAALARSQSEARREHARSERTAAVEARTRRPEYRQVARCCPEARVRELAELDERLARLVGMDALREYCADLRRDCLARVALGDAEVCPNPNPNPSPSPCPSPYPSPNRVLPTPQRPHPTPKPKPKPKPTPHQVCPRNVLISGAMGTGKKL